MLKSSSVAGSQRRVGAPYTLDMVAAPLVLFALALDLTPSQLLVVPPVGRGGRVPVHTDAIQYAFAVGEWKPPIAGDKIRSAAGQEIEWRAIVKGDDGWFRDRALNGGYAFWSLDHSREEVMLLEAAGHSMVYVNGDPRGGDVYGFGYTKLPIKLKRGKNELLFSVARGGMNVKLTPTKSSAFFNTGDLTLPDEIEGEDSSLIGGIIVINATETYQRDLIITDENNTITRLPTIPPLSARKVPFRFDKSELVAGSEREVNVVLRDNSRTLDKATVKVRVRKRTESHKRTFISNIDGSVQYYAVRPAMPRAITADPGIVLTAHGAGVEAIGQVDAYASKSWAHLVAPTNRRPYGFDWEDWGRLDALEVLEEAKRTLTHDPARIYLTGHSMGGHGTWIIGATYPDKFAAIGPSAGWISFFTYAGGAALQAITPIEKILQGATLPSDTASLVKNLAPLGVYILHGGADDNVPATQARQMVEYLKEFHMSFEYHERPGAGHWWDTSEEPGAACVDWPPMFDMFSRRRIPAVTETRRVQFVTASPGISARNGAVEIVNLIRDGELAEIEAASEPHTGTVTIKTKNVRAFFIDSKMRYAADGIFVIDGQKVEALQRLSDLRYLFVRRGEIWESRGKRTTGEKSPTAYGPFKNTFANRFVYIVGTNGTPEENHWMFSKARYDLETFWYRGNGAFDIVTDVESSSMDLANRNIILVGNADVNSAWERYITSREILVGSGRLTFGSFSSTRTDLSILFARPHPMNSDRLVGVIAFTGLEGARTIERSPYFVSGASYPDWMILSSRCLLDGNSEIVGAGFFGPDWTIDGGDFAWGKR